MSLLVVFEYAPVDPARSGGFRRTFTARFLLAQTSLRQLQEPTFAGG
jgi:hypothetical protein